MTPGLFPPPQAGASGNATSINGTNVGATNATAGTYLGGNGTSIVSLLLSGDATLSAAGVLTLATVATPGTVGDATHVAQVTVDAKGRVTSATAVAITYPGAGNLSGPITSVGLVTSVASQTGTGSKFVMDTSPTLVTPNLGTPSAGVLTNCTGTAAGLTAGNVTTNANLTGPITSAGNATAVAAQTGTGSTFVMQASPTLTTPNIGTPSAGVLTNCTGTASGLTAGNVTTNANLTGPITSAGNATSIAAQTGTGTTFVMQASPTLTTPTFQDSTDATKKMVVSMSAESTGITTTISTGAQTVNRTLNIPVLAGTDTIATLGVANTFTNILTIANRLRSSTALTTVDAGSGVASIYRVGGTIENIGSLVLQSDAGQATAGIYLYTGTTPTRKVGVPAAGGFVIGTAALSTSATDGFLYVPTCAGTPTGVPTSQTGAVALIFDTTNNKLAIYNGAWKQTVALT